MNDALGLAVSGADQSSLPHYETALAGLQRFVGDPVGAADAAIAASQGFVMAHVIKGYLYGLSTEQVAMRVAKACHEAASSLPMNERERGHVAALGHLVEGRWHEAGRALAGCIQAAHSLLEAQQEAMHGKGDNAAFTRDVGYPVTKAIHAFGEGDYARCVQLIRPVRQIAHRFGGSHAQRDVIELTLIEAAIRSGQGALARALTAERYHQRPDSPLSQLFVKRAERLGIPN